MNKNYAQVEKHFLLKYSFISVPNNILHDIEFYFIFPNLLSAQSLVHNPSLCAYKYCA